MVQSLSKSHSEFLWDTYETDYDKTLNDLIYLLRSTSQNFMNRYNSDIGYPVKLSLPNGKGSAIVNSVDQMVKRKVKSVIVLCTITKASICLIAKGRGIGCEAANFT